MPAFCLTHRNASWLNSRWLSLSRAKCKYISLRISQCSPIHDVFIKIIESLKFKTIVTYLDLHFAPCSLTALWWGKIKTSLVEMKKHGTLNASGSWRKISAAVTCANLANPAELRLKWKERNEQKVESCEESEDHVWVLENIWRTFIVDTVQDCISNFMMLAFSWQGIDAQCSSWLHDLAA